MILLLGASGFIGSGITEALLADGHAVRAAGRDLAYGRRILPGAEWVHCDLRAETDWPALLMGVDIVVNASGTLQSGLRDNVARVQEHAIANLVAACGTAGIARFIQISAASAEHQSSDFMQTKARADAIIAASGMAHTIIRPGLVIGRNGFGGTELLRAAAGLPVGVEIGGTGKIQCVALADVVAGVRCAVGATASGTFDLVEPQARPLGEIIAAHRRWLGLPQTRLSLHLPLALLRPVTLLADALGWLGWRSPLRSNAVAALAFGVKGNPGDAQALIGREAVALPQIFTGLGPAGKADRWHAQIAPIYPLAIAALVVLWLAGGVIGLARADEAAALLPRSAFSGLVVIAGSLADIAIALGLICRATLRPALLASAALATAYAVGAGVVRPDLWLDPLGPMVKVIPVIALSLLLHGMAEER